MQSEVKQDEVRHARGRVKQDKVKQDGMHADMAGRAGRQDNMAKLAGQAASTSSWVSTHACNVQQDTRGQAGQRGWQGTAMNTTSLRMRADPLASRQVASAVDHAAMGELPAASPGAHAK